MLNKEWCSFGHKFEDRLGRKGHTKEVSPVCLQFLDCCYQIINQYPTNFEYNTNFILFISKILYSGLFMNFRCNHECDRLTLIRNVGPYEDMQLEDFEYSSVSSYIHILLYSNNMNVKLLNPYYIPPIPSQKQVFYNLVYYIVIILMIYIIAFIYVLCKYIFYLLIFVIDIQLLLL